MESNIVETINVAREVSWLPWAVQYFFLIGLSYGAFMLSLPGIVFRRPDWEGTSRLALLAALVCGVTAPVALLADLHQPGRFWFFYAHFTPSSWMSWGAFFIPMYLLGLVLYAWLAFRPLLAAEGRQPGMVGTVARLLAFGGLESRGALRAAATLAFAGAALVALYTGMEVMAVRARPLWHTPFLPIQFFLTALTGAVGLTLLLRGLARRDSGSGLDVLTRTLGWLQALVLTAGVAWAVLGWTGASQEHARALAQVAYSGSWRLTAAWALAATLGTWWFAWRRPGQGVVLGLLAMHSAWMMRWTVFIGGQTIPKTGAGLYSYELPLGHDGLLGIVGTGGLWIFSLVLLTALLPLERLARPAEVADIHGASS